MNRGKKSLEKRFWAKVQKSENCWIWTGARYVNGYGEIGVDGKPKGAHRVGYELQNGPIPKGMDVLHRCDNPPCVNGAHLFLGDKRDNVLDAWAKGRAYGAPPGENHPSAKVSKAVVESIRTEYLAGKIRQMELGMKYGLSQTSISNIVNRKRWSKA